MRQIFSAIVLALLASPLVAQDLGDVGGFLGGDVSGLLNIAAPRGDAAGNRGAAPARGAAPGRAAQPAASVDRLARLRESLAAAGLPLSGQQETALNTLLDTEVPALRKTLQARVLELQKTRAAAAPASTPQPATVPAPGTTTNQVNPDELVPELTRLNDQLVGKLAASPALNPPQQAFLKKALRDQIMARKGFDALNLTMEEAKAPFTPEQSIQIQALYTEESRARSQLAVPGQPADPAKLSQLERETLTKVLRLLNPAQRTALAATIRP
jgi:hypothetical protein